MMIQRRNSLLLSFPLLLFLSMFALTASADIPVGLGVHGSGWIDIRKRANENFGHFQWIQVNWGTYNEATGQTRPVKGDVDSDSGDEIIVGLDSNSSGWFEVMEDINGANQAWLRVNWPAYNGENGETNITTGDVDGDGQEEIIVALGAAGNGWVEVFDSANGNFDHLAWGQVKWTAYNEASGVTRPTAGDFDGDGRAEIAVGLSMAGNGWVEIFEDADGGFDHKAWVRTGWGEYNTDQGLTRPCACNLDNDGADELVIGLGPGAGGWFEVRNDNNGNNFSRIQWQQVQWAGYNGGATGGTRPFCHQADFDDPEEILIGLGPRGNNWVEVFDDSISHLDWFQVKFQFYEDFNGETYPDDSRLIKQRATEHLSAARGKFSMVQGNSNDRLWMWGDNDFGQLGDGTTSDQNNPVSVQNPTATADFENAWMVTGGGFNLDAISSGHGHTVALKYDGTVWCWGNDVNGQLGNGSPMADSTTPVQVVDGNGDPLRNVIFVASGWAHSVALKADGTVWTWGKDNFEQLGDGAGSTDQPNAVQVMKEGGGPLENVVAVAAGCVHTVALKKNGTVWSWGDNRDGQLANNSVGGTEPVAVQAKENDAGDGDPLTEITAIASGAFFSMALDAEGNVWTVGDNENGQLGIGSTGGEVDDYGEVTGLSGETIAIRGGTDHGVALQNNGTVWTWGLDDNGQLGNDQNLSNSSTPVQTTDFEGEHPDEIIGIGAGEKHTILLENNGEVLTAGDNANGELGDGGAASVATRFLEVESSQGDDFNRNK